MKITCINMNTNKLSHDAVIYVTKFTRTGSENIMIVKEYA